MLVPTVAGVFVAGTAFAYWTTSGTGMGSATTGTSAVVTVAQTSTVTNLVPGGPAQAVNFSIDNPQPTAQYITSVTIAIAGVVKGGVAAVGCSAADFTIVQPTGINADLASGLTSFNSQGGTIAMLNTNANQDGCKSATLNLTLTAV